MRMLSLCFLITHIHNIFKPIWYLFLKIAIKPKFIYSDYFFHAR